MAQSGYALLRLAVPAGAVKSRKSTSSAASVPGRWTAREALGGVTGRGTGAPAWAMAAGGAGCGEAAEQCRGELERLTRELAEANREKVRAAECGLAVLEENQSLKQQCAELEQEQEALRLELEQLQEVGLARV